jgi:hypothetical protein
MRKHGRRAQVAAYLKISKQGMSNLLAGRQQLTGEQALT